MNSNCIITIDDCSPIINESQLMPCQSCGMFQYFSLSVINSYNKMNMNDYGFNSFTYSCSNCCEKFALAQQVTDLQLTVSNLQKRVTSLVNIKDAENSFDKTVMSTLINQFSNFNLSSTIIPQPAQHEVINAVSTSAQSDTSVWVSDPSNFSEHQTGSLTASPVHTDNTSDVTVSSINNNSSGCDNHFEETDHFLSPDNSFACSSVQTETSKENVNYIPESPSLTSRSEAEVPPITVNTSLTVK